MLRQFCSPIFDLDNVTKSSAYKSDFNFAPFGRTWGSDRIFLKEDGISKYNPGSKYNLGEPLSRMKRALFDFGHFFMGHIELEYELFIKLKKKKKKTATDVNL